MITSTVSSGERPVVSSQIPTRVVAFAKALVEFGHRPAGVAGTLPCALACGYGLHRGEENDDVAGPAADHRSVLAEQISCDDVLQGDGEAGLEVLVGGCGCQAVSQPQLPHGLRGGIRGHLLAATHDAAAEDVALEMHSPLGTRSEKAGDRRLASRDRAGDQINDSFTSLHVTSVGERAGRRPTRRALGGDAATTFTPARPARVRPP
jgi:hypothetical protein